MHSEQIIRDKLRNRCGLLDVVREEVAATKEDTTTYLPCLTKSATTPTVNFPGIVNSEDVNFFSVNFKRSSFLFSSTGWYIYIYSTAAHITHVGS